MTGIHVGDSVTIAGRRGKWRVHELVSYPDGHGVPEWVNVIDPRNGGLRSFALDRIVRVIPARHQTPTTSKRGNHHE